ncbi:Fc.00g093710.m01.CDS01 [Cosmosporella sp. VM-42]
MCVRSGIECQPRSVHTPTPRRRKVINSPSIESLGSNRARRRSRVSTSPNKVAEPTASVQTPNPATPVTGRDRRVTPSAGTHQFGANRSAISLAVNVYNNLGTHGPTEISSIPGDPSPGSPSGSTWALQSMVMPPSPVMETLIGVYFEKMHWFIWILHKPSFVSQARNILSSASWRREDMSKVLVTLTVAAIGLKCAIQDTSSRGQELLAWISSDSQTLLEQMIAEVRMHLLDLLDDGCIETVQVCLLLGAFYIFHGSPSLAWATIGLSVRTSYALALHCTSDDDPVTTQIRRRCWNHLTVADTFASQIYGRPASLDPAFSDLLPLAEMDDTTIDISSEDRPGGSVTGLTFHWLKYRLYEIIRETLSVFRLLQLHNPMTVEELQSLLDAVQRIDAKLTQWHSTLPPLLNNEETSRNGPQASTHWLFENFEEQDYDLQRLKLQACLLQITYDAAIILVHRPLLEYKLSSEYRQGVSKSTMESVSKSYDVCVKAALRISRTPVMQFKHEFCMAFIFIHLFTSGVILCIPPTSQPFSSTAQEAKSGVFRIIQAAKALNPHSQIARHTERLLSDLLKLSLHREVDLAFQEERGIDHKLASGEPPPAQDIQSTNGPEVGALPVENHNLPVRDASCNPYGENLLPLSPTSNSEMAHSSRQGGDTGNFGDPCVEPYLVFNNLINHDDSGTQPLDLELDEAFGAFGQVMFNLMPDDPLNSWGWGKGSM